MYNGYAPDWKKLADGNGFKAGGYGSAPASRLPQKIPRHVVRFCLSVGNKNSGFYANHHPGGSDWLHNTAYRNGAGFNMLGRLRDNRTDVDGYGHKLMNNLSYGTRGAIVKFDAEKCESANNSFSLDLKLTAKDFASLDVGELFWPRQQNGNLPNIDLMRPAPGSAVIDAGVEIGLRFLGAKPDIGAFER